MWSWEMKAGEHQWCISRGKWGTEMYGDNYFLQSSGLPPALLLCAPSVTDLHLSPETCVCVCVCGMVWYEYMLCVCVCENLSKLSSSVINHYWLTEYVWRKIESGKLNTHANFRCDDTRLSTLLVYFCLWKSDHTKYINSLLNDILIKAFTVKWALFFW